MFFLWTGKEFYWYFKIEGVTIGIKFVPFIKKNDKTTKHFEWWKVK